MLQDRHKNPSWRLWEPAGETKPVRQSTAWNLVTFVASPSFGLPSIPKTAPEPPRRAQRGGTRRSPRTPPPEDAPKASGDPGGLRGLSTGALKRPSRSFWCTPQARWRDGPRATGSAAP
eukprot:1729560-Pyramimonas_sp.AAC.1